MNRVTEQFIHMIDMALAHTDIVQLILPPGYAKTTISQILKERGNWITPNTVITDRLLKDMALNYPSMNLLINHFTRRTLEIPDEFKRQIILLGHQPITIKNRPYIVMQYNLPQW